MDSWKELLIAGCAWLLLAVLCQAVLLGPWFRFRARGNPVRWLPLERRRRISWHGFDVIVIFVLSALVPVFVDESLKRLGLFDWLYGEANNPAMRDRKMLWSSTLAVPLVILLILLGLHCVRRTRPAELGLMRTYLLPNITLGYCCWLILTPMALLLYWALLQVTPAELQKPHWVAEAGQQQLWPIEWVLMLLVTVVLAPLLEELLFRGVLLPWQLRGGWETQAVVAFFALAFAAMGGMGAEKKDDDPFKNYNVLPVLFVLAMLPGLVVVPNLWKRMPAPSEPTSTTEPPTDWQQRFERHVAEILRNAGEPHAQAGLAIYTNALLFAAMHSMVWPSPVPLFLLGLGLAWLKVRTTSLVGCLTLHALFNAVAMLEIVLTHVFAL